MYSYIASLITLLATLHSVASVPVATPAADLPTFTIDANGTLHKVDSRSVDPRMVGPPPNPCTASYVLVGDGSPNQWYFQKQVTETVSDCQGVSCTTSKSDGQTYSWGISISLSPTPAGLTPDALKGSGTGIGFDWSESYSSSESEGCSTDNADNICLWYSQAYTSTNVLQEWVGDCDGRPSVPMTLYAPNTDNAGGLGYYCVSNTCRSAGQGYWTQGRAGNA